MSRRKRNSGLHQRGRGESIARQVPTHRGPDRSLYRLGSRFRTRVLLMDTHAENSVDVVFPEDELTTALKLMTQTHGDLLKALGGLAIETQTCTVNLGDVQALLASICTRLADMETRIEELERIALSGRRGES